MISMSSELNISYFSKNGVLFSKSITFLKYRLPPEHYRKLLNPTHQVDNNNLKNNKKSLIETLISEASDCRYNIMSKLWCNEWYYDVRIGTTVELLTFTIECGYASYANELQWEWIRERTLGVFIVEGWDKWTEGEMAAVAGLYGLGDDSKTGRHRKKQIAKDREDRSHDSREDRLEQ